MSDDALDLGPLPDPAPPLSADRRRTQRQADRIALGVHPLTMTTLHPDAPTDLRPDGPRDRPFTCGSCVHRVQVRHHDQTFPKCEQSGRAHSASSDCRAWWPACRLYEADPC